MSGARLWLAAALLGAARAGAAEGGRPIVAEVRVEGLREVSARDVEKILPVKAGQPFDARSQALAREMTLSFLQSRGYLDAQASARAAVFESSAVFVVSAREGPLYRFGRTKFAGLSRLSERALRHELPYDEGDAYRRSELLAAQSRLFGLGLFEDIDIEASTTTGKTAEVTVRVKERPLKWVKTGVGYGSDERERLSLALTHNNLFGRAYTGEASVLYSHIWLEYRGDFVNRHFWGTDAEQRTSVSWRRENRPGYDLERSLGSFGLSSALPDHWRVTTQYKVSRTVLYKVDPAISVGEPDKPLQSGVSLGFDYDTTDDPFFPTRGLRAGLLAERQGGSFGGDVDLNRGAARGAGYWTPFWKLVAAASLSAGVVRQFAPSTTVPIFERWFMGGGTTVRGYRERDVGPKDDQGNPIGGNVFARGSVEARFPLFWRLGGVLFVDGGQTDPDQANVAPSKWKWGAGPGLRLKTPVGPVRLDAGWKVNPSPDVAHWVFHFSLGEAF